MLIVTMHKRSWCSVVNDTKCFCSYEGTGRSLSLKLIQQLREQNASLGTMASKTDTTPSAGVLGRTLHEVALNESIRYAPGDDVEQWLNGLLCLDATVVPRVSSGCPLPENCELYLLVSNGDSTRLMDQSRFLGNYSPFPPLRYG